VPWLLGTSHELSPSRLRLSHPSWIALYIQVRARHRPRLELEEVRFDSIRPTFLLANAPNAGMAPTRTDIERSSSLSLQERWLTSPEQAKDELRARSAFSAGLRLGNLFRSLSLGSPCSMRVQLVPRRSGASRNPNHELEMRFSTLAGVGRRPGVLSAADGGRDGLYESNRLSGLSSRAMHTNATTVRPFFFSIRIGTRLLLVSHRRLPVRPCLLLRLLPTQQATAPPTRGRLLRRRVPGASEPGSYRLSRGRGVRRAPDFETTRCGGTVRCIERVSFQLAPAKGYGRSLTWFF
jgi:hypothetical protein